MCGCCTIQTFDRQTEWILFRSISVVNGGAKLFISSIYPYKYVDFVRLFEAHQLELNYLDLSGDNCSVAMRMTERYDMPSAARFSYLFATL